METIICDISAFLYWRVPPVVRLLASAADDDPLLANLVSPEELSNLCAGCAELPWLAHAHPPALTGGLPGRPRARFARRRRFSLCAWKDPWTCW